MYVCGVCTCVYICVRGCVYIQDMYMCFHMYKCISVNTWKRERPNKPPTLTLLNDTRTLYSLCSRPSPFVHIRTLYKRMRYTQKWGRPGMKYHVKIVGGAIGKTLLLFPGPEARSPSHLVKELLAGRIICTTCVMLSIWLLS